MLIDGLAQRYSVLPSQLIEKGDTFDLMCMDVAVTYQMHKNNENKDRSQLYDPKDLQERMDKVRNG